MKAGLLMFWFTLGSAFGQTEEALPLRQECLPILKAGMTFSYNGWYAKADEKFDELRNCDRESSVGDWRKALNAYAYVRAAQGGIDIPRVDPEFYAKFAALVKEGTRKADAGAAATGKEKEICLYIAASLNSVGSVMALKNEGKIAAYRMIKRAEAYAERSHYPDAGYIIGMINYEASTNPNLIDRFLLGRFLPNDRCKGLRLIQAAEQGNEGMFADDVRMVMFSIAMKAKKGQLEGCRDYHPGLRAEALLMKYPNNGLLRQFLQR